MLETLAALDGITGKEQMHRKRYADPIPESGLTTTGIF